MLFVKLCCLLMLALCCYVGCVLCSGAWLFIVCVLLPRFCYCLQIVVACLVCLCGVN